MLDWQAEKASADLGLDAGGLLGLCYNPSMAVFGADGMIGGPCLRGLHLKYLAHGLIARV